jgi:BirA family biotin operon repressor/biotin-[acetyl-CoA-carboxylase] ligase
MSPSALATQSLQSALSDLARLHQIIHYTSIGSTNDRARQLADAGEPEFVLISTDEQTAGRGRQGRSWFTPPETALAFSLLTRPAIAATQAMRLTMLAGLAAVEGIEAATDLRLDLKWPNDVIAFLPVREGPGEGRLLKVGGILTEASFQNDHIEYAVVGMGLNVNVDFSSQPELRSIATSLKHLTGNEIDRLAVLAAIVRRFVERYDWLEKETLLRRAWAARLINLGRKVKVQTGAAIVEGLAEGVDLDGALLVRSAEGQLHRLLAGDVTLHGTAQA